ALPLRLARAPFRSGVEAAEPGEDIDHVHGHEQVLPDDARRNPVPHQPRPRALMPFANLLGVVADVDEVAHGLVPFVKRLHELAMKEPADGRIFANSALTLRIRL